MTRDLPNDINVKGNNEWRFLTLIIVNSKSLHFFHLEFWTLPPQDWKNVTKYDFYFILEKLSVCKDKAHLAYKNDIEKLQKGSSKTSNRFQLLEACKAELKVKWNCV